MLGIKNPSDQKKRLDQADFNTTEVRSGNQNRNMGIVSESGLYDVILDSRKPEAKEFRRWITSEVIPSIRKHGAYLTAEKIEEVLFKAPTVTAGLAESHFFVLEL